MCNVNLNNMQESCGAPNAAAAGGQQQYAAPGHLLLQVNSKDAVSVAAAAAPPSSTSSSPRPRPPQTPAPHPNSHDDNINSPHNISHVDSPAPSTSTLLRVVDDDHDHPTLSFNLITCTTSHDQNDILAAEADRHIDQCTPGSPEFFLPANAYISLDDPASLMLCTSHISPGSGGSDPSSSGGWPACNAISPSSALLNCPSIFSAISAGNSSDESSNMSCDQISSHVDACSQTLYNTSPYAGLHDAGSTYTSLLQSHHYPVPGALFCVNGMQPSNFNGYSQLMQASPIEYPYYPGGSGPYTNFSNLYTNAAPRMTPAAVFPPNTRAGMLEQCLNEAAQHEQEEQSWYTFLQPSQEDHDDAEAPHQEKDIAIGRTRMGGSTGVNLMTAVGPQYHDYMQVPGARVPHVLPGMPMAGLHCQTMEDPNARSPTNYSQMMQPMQLKRAHQLEAGPQTDATVSCCTSISNKRRRTPEGEDSWPSADADACSPPLKMKRSPSFSSPAPAGDQPYAANFSQKHINGNSATLSPSKQLITICPPKLESSNTTGSPTLSNNQPDQQQPRKSGKSTTRQTVCNDPQSVAARHRRERISERLKTLQQLVPNGAKVDLVTMLEKAISYVKSLQLQVKVLSTDEYWPTPLSDKYSLNNLAAVAKLAASTYN